MAGVACSNALSSLGAEVFWMAFMWLAGTAAMCAGTDVAPCIAPPRHLRPLLGEQVRLALEVMFEGVQGAGDLGGVTSAPDAAAPAEAKALGAQAEGASAVQAVPHGESGDAAQSGAAGRDGAGAAGNRGGPAGTSGGAAQAAAGDSKAGLGLGSGQAAAGGGGGGELVGVGVALRVAGCVTVTHEPGGPGGTDGGTAARAGDHGAAVLEWEGGAPGDGVADAIVAVILQARPWCSAQQLCDAALLAHTACLRLCVLMTNVKNPSGTRRAKLVPRGHGIRMAPLQGGFSARMSSQHMRAGVQQGWRARKLHSAL